MKMSEHEQRGVPHLCWKACDFICGVKFMFYDKGIHHLGKPSPSILIQRLTCTVSGLLRWRTLLAAVVEKPGKYVGPNDRGMGHSQANVLDGCVDFHSALTCIVLANIIRAKVDYYKCREHYFSGGWRPSWGDPVGSATLPMPANHDIRLPDLEIIALRGPLLCPPD